MSEEHVKVLPQGIRIVTRVPGDEKTYPRAQDLVKIDYIGLFMSGEWFDSTYARNEPFICTLDNGEIIAGWELAIPEMSLGEEAQVYIPAEYAYGSEGAGEAIPPNTDIIFDMKLLQVNDNEFSGPQDEDNSEKACTVQKVKLEAGDETTYPQHGSTVEVRYVGKLFPSMKEFDRSRPERGNFRFPVGVGYVIGGWDLAIPGLSLGEKVELLVPSVLAYADKGVENLIPPNEDLFFTIQVLAIDGKRADVDTSIPLIDSSDESDLIEDKSEDSKTKESGDYEEAEVSQENEFKDERNTMNISYTHEIQENQPIIEYNSSITESQNQEPIKRNSITVEEVNVEGGRIDLERRYSVNSHISQTNLSSEGVNMYLKEPQRYLTQGNESRVNSQQDVSTYNDNCSERYQPTSQVYIEPQEYHTQQHPQTQQIDSNLIGTRLSTSHNVNSIPLQNTNISREPIRYVAGLSGQPLYNDITYDRPQNVSNSSIRASQYTSQRYVPPSANLRVLPNYQPSSQVQPQLYQSNQFKQSNNSSLHINNIENSDQHPGRHYTSQQIGQQIPNLQHQSQNQISNNNHQQIGQQIPNLQHQSHNQISNNNHQQIGQQIPNLQHQSHNQISNNNHQQIAQPIHHQSHNQINNNSHQQISQPIQQIPNLHHQNNIQISNTSQQRVQRIPTLQRPIASNNMPEPIYQPQQRQTGYHPSSNTFQQSIDYRGNQNSSVAREYQPIRGNTGYVHYENQHLPLNSYQPQPTSQIRPVTNSMIYGSQHQPVYKIRSDMSYAPPVPVLNNRNSIQQPSYFSSYIPPTGQPQVRRY